MNISRCSAKLYIHLSCESLEVCVLNLQPLGSFTSPIIGNSTVHDIVLSQCCERTVIPLVAVNQSNMVMCSSTVPVFSSILKLFGAVSCVGIVEVQSGTSITRGLIEPLSENSAVLKLINSDMEIKLNEDIWKALTDLNGMPKLSTLPLDRSPRLPKMLMTAKRTLGLRGRSQSLLMESKRLILTSKSIKNDKNASNKYPSCPVNDIRKDNGSTCEPHKQKARLRTISQAPVISDRPSLVKYLKDEYDSFLRGFSPVVFYVQSTVSFAARHISLLSASVISGSASKSPRNLNPAARSETMDILENEVLIDAFALKIKYRLAEIANAEDQQRCLREFSTQVLLRVEMITTLMDDDMNQQYLIEDCSLLLRTVALSADPTFPGLFLENTVLGNYFHKSPDVLVALYDELGLPLHAKLTTYLDSLSSSSGVLNDRSETSSSICSSSPEKFTTSELSREGYSRNAATKRFGLYHFPRFRQISMPENCNRLDEERRLRRRKRHHTLKLKRSTAKKSLFPESPSRKKRERTVACKLSRSRSHTQRSFPIVEGKILSPLKGLTDGKHPRPTSKPRYNDPLTNKPITLKTLTAGETPEKYQTSSPLLKRISRRCGKIERPGDNLNIVPETPEVDQKVLPRSKSVSTFSRRSSFYSLSNKTSQSRSIARAVLNEDKARDALNMKMENHGLLLTPTKSESSLFHPGCKLIVQPGHNTPKYKENTFTFVTPTKPPLRSPYSSTLFSPAYSRKKKQSPDAVECNIPVAKPSGSSARFSSFNRTVNKFWSLDRRLVKKNLRLTPIKQRPSLYDEVVTPKNSPLSSNNVAGESVQGCRVPSGSAGFKTGVHSERVNVFSILDDLKQPGEFFVGFNDDDICKSKTFHHSLYRESYSITNDSDRDAEDDLDRGNVSKSPMRSHRRWLTDSEVSLEMSEFNVRKSTARKDLTKSFPEVSKANSTSLCKMRVKRCSADSAYHTMSSSTHLDGQAESSLDVETIQQLAETISNDHTLVSDSQALPMVFTDILEEIPGSSPNGSSCNLNVYQNVLSNSPMFRKGSSLSPNIPKDLNVMPSTSSIRHLINSPLVCAPPSNESRKIDL